jgi:hypothetical protein
LANAASRPKETVMLGRFVVVLPLLTAGAAVAQAPSPVATVQYSCAQGKSLAAE